MKKRFLSTKTTYLFIFLILFIFFLVPKISANSNQSNGTTKFNLESFKNLFTSQEGGGLFDVIKTKVAIAWNYLDLKVAMAWNYFDLKVGWISGANTFKGNYVYGTWNFWINRLIFMFFLFIWMGLFYPITTLKIIEGKAPESIYNFYYVDSFFYAMKDSFKLDYIKSRKIYIILTIYLILSIIPYLMRLLQIITLEILGVGVLLRTFIIAVILSYVPFYLKKYGEYKRRTYEYKKALEKVAIEEAMKARING